MFCTLVQAHPPGLSSADITLTAESVEALVTFAVEDIEALQPLDSDLDAEVSTAELEAARTTLVPLATQALAISVDGTLRTPADTAQVSFDDKNNIHIRFTLTGRVQSRVEVQPSLLDALPKGHRQFVSIKDNEGSLLGEKMLVSNGDSLTVTVAGTGNASAEAKTGAERGTISDNTFLAFLKLGIEHILTGYDHLLFLLALLAVVQGFWPTVKIITAFTVAHSITLALASLNIAQMPREVVEPLIALTIVYVGVENLVRKEPPKGRWILTFFFGLIHGFGFAGALRDMGIASGEMGILVPLFSFNLGVELGQLTVAGFVLPIIGWARLRPVLASRWTQVCSIPVVLAGCYWLVERTLIS